MSKASDKQSGAVPRLKTSVDGDDSVVRFSLEGELDLATVGVAEEALKRADDATKTLVLDLRKLRFLDSTGLRLILSTAESSDTAAKRVYVVRGPAQVDRVFELTGAAERLNLVDDPSLIDQS